MLIPKLKYYVNDYSWVLKPSRTQKIDTEFRSLYINTDIQAVTVLFPHRKWKALKDIALEIFNSNGIGKKWKNSGLLLIISTDEKKIRIMVWKGLEWTYTTQWCKYIIETKLRALVESWKYEEVLKIWDEEVAKLSLNIIVPPSIWKVVSVFFWIFLYICTYLTVLTVLWIPQALCMFLFFACIILYFSIKRNTYGWLAVFIFISLFFLFWAFMSSLQSNTCNKNQETCQQSDYSRGSSNYKSSSSSSSSRSSSSSSSSSSRGSFGGWWWSSNWGGWGD